jgi:hypothetical protein
MTTPYKFVKQLSKLKLSPLEQDLTIPLIRTKVVRSFPHYPKTMAYAVTMAYAGLK